VFELTASEVDRLKAAYTELFKITKNDDPRGWYRQGAVHCWYCSGAGDSLNGMEIHGGWWFFAWHRAYLYFHETILGKLIGDPSFALPYWDWDSCKDDPNDMTGRNRFPGRSTVFRPTSIQIRCSTPRARWKGRQDSDLRRRSTAMNAILGAKSFSDFGGSGNEELPVFAQTANAPQQAGTLEAGPHGMVHLWTTDPKNFSGLADMGCSPRQRSIRCSSRTTPISTVSGANGSRWPGTPTRPTIVGSINSRFTFTIRPRSGLES